MPSVNSSSVPNVFDSSTVTTPSLPTLSMASAMTSPIDGSAAEMVATLAMSVLSSTSLACDLIDSTAAATAFSMPFLRLIGLAPAATLRMPRWTSDWASTVAVVVPSPATSLVLVATSLTSWAPMFSNGSSSSTSLAIDTPSLVIVGAPHFLSSTTLRPFGPSVTLTASASLLTPASSARRASSSNFSSLAIGQLSTIASTSRLDRISRSSPSMVTSVPPYLRVQDGLADLDVERDQLAGVLGALAGADGEDLALLRLLLGGVGDDEARRGRLLGLVGLDDDAVIERLQGHGGKPPLARWTGVGLRTERALALGRCECQWYGTRQRR